MKISEMTEDDAKQCLFDSYMDLHNAIATGDAEGPHPSKDLGRWRAAAAGAPVTANIEKGEDVGGLGPVEIQNKKKPGAQDDEQPEITGGLPSKKPAMDGAEDDRIRLSGHHDVPGQLAAAAARRSNPAAVRGMAAAIPSYRRLK